MRKEILVAEQAKSKNNTVLTAGLEADKKTVFIQQYSSSFEVRHRIASILADKLEKTIKDDEKKDLYEVPNWELHQADSRGYRRAIREALSLLTYSYNEVDHDR